MTKREIRLLKHELTEHHVPPRWTKQSAFVRNVPRNQHDAYHTALGAPASYEAACKELWERFWKPPENPNEGKIL